MAMETEAQDAELDLDDSSPRKEGARFQTPLPTSES